MQPSPLSNSRTFSSPHKETLYQLAVPTYVSHNYRNSSPSHSTRWGLFLVKLIFNMVHSVLLYVIFLQRLSSTVHQVLLHFLQRVDIFDRSISVSRGYRRTGASWLQWSRGGGAGKAQTQWGAACATVYLFLSLFFSILVGGRRTSTLLTDTCMYKCFIVHDIPVGKTGRSLSKE